MGVRYRSATSGTLLCLVATALLAVVSFNTPLIKSLYFLSATYSSGQYSGTIRLGTLGYCLDTGGTTTCTGPRVGYEFNPNQLLGITVFNIPETITKYLTYTLIIHIVALACAVASVIFGLLSHISTLSVMCFPTCTASLTSTFSLIALIFDLVIFYIAKSRIDAVAGASATIGISVWLTLAAWIISGLAGCAYGVGRCCMGSRNNQQSGDPKADKGYYHQGGPDDMRMQAIRDEQLRKKEQGLPGFQEHERTPLTAGEGEDKYLHEDQQLMPGSLRRDGSVVQGVGMGYGRKNSRTPMNVQGYPRGGVDSQQGYPGGWAPQDGYGNYTDLAPVPVARRPSVASGLTSAGGAGIGAGGGGVERNEPQRYGGYYGNGQQNYYDQQGYADPYQPQQVDPYPPQQYDYSAPQQYNPQQQQHHYPPQSTTPYPPQSTSPYPPQSHTPLTLANPTPIPRHVSDGHDPYTGPGSSESHYNDPGPRISHEDPYDGYDDGVGHIGMAATSPNLNEPPHQRDYTAGTFGYPDHRQYPSDRQAPLHIPTPQHLVTGPSSATNLLRSPPPSQGRDGARGGYDYDEDDEEDAGMRPPSYGQVAGGSAGYQPPRSVNEKNGYR